MNAPAERTLFREEVRATQGERLHGDIHLALPIRWHVIGFSLLGVVLFAVAFLALGTYSRVERVNGILVLDRGAALIVPSRSGVVARVHVGDGETIRAGTPLVEIRVEEDMAAGATAPTRAIGAIEEQNVRLRRQAEMMMRAAGANRARLQAQAAGLAQEIQTLDRQIRAQQRLVEVARADYDQTRSIAGRGFISRRDLELREANMIERQQQLMQLQQSRTAKASSLAESERQMAQVLASAEAEVAGVESGRSALGQQLAEAQAARGYTLTAPSDGVVTALVARVGQTAVGGEPLMTVLPGGSRLHAELYVPSAAAGFLAQGQEVRLAIDAFASERFGPVPARIVLISGTTVTRPGPNGAPTAVYLVRAELLRDHVTAYGRRQPLLPGMSLSARIVTDRRTFLEWLFEPVFAIGSR